MEKVAPGGDSGDKVSEVMAALRSVVHHFQPSFSAKSNSSVVAPSVFGSHIENFNISVNTTAPEERRCHDQNEEPRANLNAEIRLVEDCQSKLKFTLKKKFCYLLEGTTNESGKVSLNSIYTELYITEGGAGEVNQEHEVLQIEALTKSTSTDVKSIHYNNLFKAQPGREHSARTVLTRGVAGIGKTVATKKLTLDWAEDKANADFDFVFPLCLRELNLMKAKRLSLEGLFCVFFPEINDSGVIRSSKWTKLIILDGLDESRIDLDFRNCEIVSDVCEPNHLGALLVNLIRGNLLRTSPVWITSRPAASGQIPGECVDLLTEVRGFNNPQKDEYFRRKISNKIIANKIISHIKSCRSLHIMCHIPIFCWMAAKVLEKNDNKNLPRSLTQMYVNFLGIFIDSMKRRLQNSEVDLVEYTRTNLITLGKLAFKGLEKGNLVFYESDLRINGIKAEQESIFSGIYTEIFNEETAIYGEKMFCFVHLSVQEFFAALYVFLMFHNENNNVLIKKSSATRRFLFRESSELILYKEAIERTLCSSGGQYDMFLRFLLGLSQEVNSLTRRKLLTKNQTNNKKTKEIIGYIKDRIKMAPPPDRCLNLFHCLNELNDRSLVEEIQSFIKAGGVDKTRLTPSQWASLVFVLLTSDEELKTFDLANYARSEEGLLRMLPVVRASQIVNLSACGLYASSCPALSSVLGSSLIQELDLSRNHIADTGLHSLCGGLARCKVHTLRLKGCGLTEPGAKSLSSLLSSAHCQLKSLDVSDNDCGDGGVQRLSEGLSSPHCPLEVLNLSLCRVSERGCMFLASALNRGVLKELDLSYNHPGQSGVQLLTALKDDPLCSLRKLSVEECGEPRLGPGPKKYAVRLTLDPNTSHKDLSLSDQNRTATRGLNPACPSPKDKFDFWTQVLCTQGLAGRCYWETEVDGRACVGVAYKHMRRKGEGPESRLGQNEQSWGLNCNKDGFKAVHNGAVTSAPAPLTSNKLGVFLDYFGGKLSYFSVLEGELQHIFTFQANFTDPVYPAFHLAWVGASVHLC
ncbi:NLR family CARD domain-containing protein 3-like [Eucyclogobius newberryi]|uniref:NLR family CARD domain-containing protein 3-like n=1 Tax=Eucyclogobius newberryi TaxID=166745 RepID=UPI003B5A5060